jgi:hypothetical protein
LERCAPVGHCIITRRRHRIFTPFDRKEQWSTVSPDEDLAQLQSIMVAAMPDRAGDAHSAHAMRGASADESAINH